MTHNYKTEMAKKLWIHYKVKKLFRVSVDLFNKYKEECHGEGRSIRLAKWGKEKISKCYKI